ncbi:MAG TPA: HAD-IIIA family hydrolase [Ferruginibacter sp.]|nr:HAD-IIIA family hydrolase [Ferruginibacter sp.]HMP22405.1 HAD-IIIA family hydrolase [Ferruginibacter sp.]
MKELKNINTSWTLFLDRDGVINHEKHLGYILHWDEFIFYDGVKEALQIFSGIFGRIVVVTNQRGVGKALMSEQDLNSIHTNMIADIAHHGGRIDKVYYCSSIDNNHPCRKPNPGMALQARQDFPEIDFNKSIMIGNTLSDMDFGRKIGAFTIFLPTTRPEVPHQHPSIDAVYPSLWHVAKAIQQ